MALINVSVFLVAIAFALVAIYLAKILLRISTFLKTMRGTVQVMEKNVDFTVLELEETLKATDVTVTDVETKLKAVDSVFDVVQDVGETTALISETIHTRTKQFSDAKTTIGMMPFIRAIQLGEFSKGAFRSWQRGKGVSS